MRMSFRIFMLAAMLAVPSLAAAGPITTGVWSPVTNPANDGGEFWDNLSVDDATCTVICNAGAILDRLFGPVEYLHDGSGGAVAFSFGEPVTHQYFASLTGWGGGIFSQQADGSFTYNANQTSHPGHISNSLDDPGQFALFRKAIPGGFQYWVGVEDIRFDMQLPPDIISDLDYNDYMVTFSQVSNVPEPGLLLLMGSGIFAATRRFRRGAR
ncbi:MAG TPA: PEP-CTERM sorting domain-containing protein [Vicinamibacterales bacterium]